MEFKEFVEMMGYEKLLGLVYLRDIFLEGGFTGGAESEFIKNQYKTYCKEAVKKYEPSSIDDYIEELRNPYGLKKKQ